MSADQRLNSWQELFGPHAGPVPVPALACVSQAQGLGCCYPNTRVLTELARGERRIPHACCIQQASTRTPP